MKSADQHGVALPCTSNRQTLLVGVGTLALVGVWMLFAMVGAFFIRSAYRGEGSAFFNHMITGQTEHSLDDYLARWNVLRWSGLGVVLSAGAFLAVATRSRPRWLVRFGPPVCAFLLVRGLLWVSFAAAPAMLTVTRHHPGADGQEGGKIGVISSLPAPSHEADGSPAIFVTSFNLEAWSRWDSHVYQSIARGGYEFYPCDIPREGAPIARQGGWCGNCAWFPGYPALIWLMARFGVPELAGGVLLSAIFCLLSVCLLWIEFLGAEPAFKNFLCLLFASLFPGSVFYHAVFPISMMTFFMCWSLHCALKEQWALCGLTASVASFTYPPGAFLALVFAAWYFYWFKNLRWRDKLWRTITVAAITSVGVALVFIVQRLFVGAWFTFLRAQGGIKSDLMAQSTESFIGSLHPVAVLVHSAQVVLGNWATPGDLIVSANTLFIAAIAILLLAFGVRTARRSPVEAYQVIFLLVFWLALLSSGVWSQPRKQALLLPAVPLARNLPPWILGVIVGVAFVFELLLGALYAKAALI